MEFCIAYTFIESLAKLPEQVRQKHESLHPQAEFNLFVGMGSNSQL